MHHHSFVPGRRTGGGRADPAAGRSLADDDVVPRQCRDRDRRRRHRCAGGISPEGRAPRPGGRGLKAIVHALVRGAAVDPVIWARTLPSRSTDALYDDDDDERDDDGLGREGEQSGEASGSSPPIEAIEAIDSTRRWSENFVRRLGLCPWAGSSLDVPGAIRYWVLLLARDDGRRRRREGGRVGGAGGRQYSRAPGTRRDRSVPRRWPGRLHVRRDRSEGRDLLRRACRGRRPSPSPSRTSGGTTLLPDFGFYHESFLDLEDRLLDKCDEYWVDNEAREPGRGGRDDGNGAMLKSKRKGNHPGPIGQLKPIKGALLRYIFEQHKQSMAVATFDLAVKASTLSAKFGAKHFTARADLLVYQMGTQETQQKPEEVATEAAEYMALMWMDKQVMFDWVDNVLAPYVATAPEDVIPVLPADKAQCCGVDRSGGGGDAE
ncbi:hypothetical protein ACHAW5_001215 [Stephanodiscus triporus]|uniref:Uncharacterized protein n=1 Tax=Stephanodiscus triporus TaxID=2934178 RepID=A0ABD3PE75_9STRA